MIVLYHGGGWSSVTGHCYRCPRHALFALVTGTEEEYVQDLFRIIDAATHFYLRSVRNFMFIIENFGKSQSINQSINQDYTSL